MSAKSPVISIITICDNAATTTEKKLQSVAAQDYPHMEYLIIDGKSTDNTLYIMERSREHMSCVISEPKVSTMR